MNEVRNIYNNPCLFAILSFNSSDNLFASLALNFDFDAIFFNFSKAISSSNLSCSARTNALEKTLDKLTSFTNLSYIFLYSSGNSNSIFIVAIYKFVLIKLLFLRNCCLTVQQFESHAFDLSRNLAENNSLASITNFTFMSYINPFSLSSCNKPSLTFSPSFIASSSVSLLFVDNISNTHLCSSFDFFNSSSKIFSVFLLTLTTNGNSRRNLNNLRVNRKDAIYQPSASYLFHIFFLIFLPSFMHSFSVSLLFDNILFHLSRSKNLTVSILLKNSILLANSFSSLLPSFGILTTISGINNGCFFSLNFPKGVWTEGKVIVK